jgi:hypothetical protein
METRGLMMLVAGFGLMLAPAAYVMTQDKEPAATETAAESDAEPAADATVEDLAEAQAEPACDGPAIISTSERVDCNGDTIKDTSRRETSGGAVFVRVGD